KGRPSEIDVQPELHDSRRIELRAQHPERLGRLQAHARIGKLHHVERVEELAAERRAPALGKHELTGDREIQIPAPQTAQLTAAAAGRIDADHRRTEGVEYGQRICEQIQSRAAASWIAVDAYLSRRVARDAGVHAIAESILGQQNRARAVATAALAELLPRPTCDL